MLIFELKECVADTPNSINPQHYINWVNSHLSFNETLCSNRLLFISFFCVCDVGVVVVIIIIIIIFFSFIIKIFKKLICSPFQLVKLLEWCHRKSLPFLSKFTSPLHCLLIFTPILFLSKHAILPTEWGAVLYSDTIRTRVKRHLLFLKFWNYFYWYC